MRVAKLANNADAITIQSAASALLDHMERRKRNPIKPASIATFQSYLRVHITPRLGNLTVASIGVARLRNFIAELNEAGLSAKTQVEITSLVKQIVASVCDSEGEPLYPRVWNNDRLDLPIVNAQHQPTVTVSELEKLLAESEPRDRCLYGLLSGSGLRIGEARSLRIGHVDGVSCWLPDESMLVIRTSFWRNSEQAPKTPSAIRQIELCKPLNDMLIHFVSGRDSGFLFQSSENSVPSESTLRCHLEARLPGRGFHSMRRLRVTVLRRARCHEEILRYWTGHAGESMTDRYSKLSSDALYRRSECERISLGFNLPARTP